jgi:hypothetical protein
VPIQTVVKKIGFPCRKPDPVEERSEKMKKLMSIVVFSFVFFSLYARGSAEVPKKLNYQGKLTDSNGGLIVNDTVEMQFDIYPYLTGGTSLWSETHDEVEIANGLFSVELGSETPVPASVFSGDPRYLEITVDSYVMSPRTPILSVGYAYRAWHADTAALCMTHADSDWVIADPNIYRLEGNVGIGTAYPGCKLQVALEEDSSAALCVSAVGTETYGVSATAGGGNTAGGDAIGVKGRAIAGINGRDNIYGGFFLTDPIFWASKNYGVWAHGSASSSDTTWGIYARGSGEWSNATYGLYAVATCTTGLAYGVYGQVPAGVAGYAGYFDGEKSFFSGHLGVGEDDPGAKLDVYAEGGKGVQSRVDGNSGDKYAAYLDAFGQGEANIGLFARGGCWGWECQPASANIGVWAIDGSKGNTPIMPSGNWAGYFDGDVRVKDSLDVGGNVTVDDDLTVGGTIKLSFDFDTTVSIGAGSSKTLTHNLGGDAGNYIVFIHGINSSGIHQSHLGSAYYSLWGWVGCEWDELTSTTVEVHRGAGDNNPPASKRWNQVRVRILKNQ